MYKSTQENELFSPRSFVYNVSNTRKKNDYFLQQNE